jgi:hypothetical protein
MNIDYPRNNCITNRTRRILDRMIENYARVRIGEFMSTNKHRAFKIMDALDRVNEALFWHELAYCESNKDICMDWAKKKEYLYCIKVNGQE